MQTKLSLHYYAVDIFFNNEYQSRWFICTDLGKKALEFLFSEFSREAPVYCSVFICSKKEAVNMSHNQVYGFDDIQDYLTELCFPEELLKCEK